MHEQEKESYKSNNLNKILELYTSKFYSSVHPVINNNSEYYTQNNHYKTDKKELSKYHQGVTRVVIKEYIKKSKEALLKLYPYKKETGDLFEKEENENDKSKTPTRRELDKHYYISLEKHLSNNVFDNTIKNLYKLIYKEKKIEGDIEIDDAATKVKIVKNAFILLNDFINISEADEIISLLNIIHGIQLQFYNLDKRGGIIYSRSNDLTRLNNWPYNDSTVVTKERATEPNKENYKIGIIDTDTVKREIKLDEEKHKEGLTEAEKEVLHNLFSNEILQPFTYELKNSTRNGQIIALSDFTALIEYKANEKERAYNNGHNLFRKEFYFVPDNEYMTANMVLATRINPEVIDGPTEFYKFMVEEGYGKNIICKKNDYVFCKLLIDIIYDVGRCFKIEEKGKNILKNNSDSYEFKAVGRKKMIDEQITSINLGKTTADSDEIKYLVKTKNSYNHPSYSDRCRFDIVKFKKAFYIENEMKKNILDLDKITEQKLLVLYLILTEEITIGKADRYILCEKEMLFSYFSRFLFIEIINKLSCEELSKESKSVFPFLYGLYDDIVKEYVEDNENEIFLKLGYLDKRILITNKDLQVNKKNKDSLDSKNINFEKANNKIIYSCQELITVLKEVKEESQKPEDDNTYKESATRRIKQEENGDSLENKLKKGVLKTK